MRASIVVNATLLEESVLVFNINSVTVLHQYNHNFSDINVK